MLLSSTLGLARGKMRETEEIRRKEIVVDYTSSPRRDQ